MVPYKATVVGFDGAMVGSLVLGVPNNTRRKLRDGCFLALNGQNLMKEHNNQPAIDDRDSVEVEEAVHGGKSEWGEVVPLLRATIWMTKK